MKNNRNTADLIVITSYPRRGKTHGAGTVGIASYTKNTLLSILNFAKKKHFKPKIVILAEEFEEEVNKYKESGLEVRRIWKRNNPLLFLSLIQGIIQFWSTKKVLIEFELSMFGNWGILVLFPFFLFLLKILGKEIIFVSHQVIDDINELSGHVGVEKESIQADVINVLVHTFYKLIFLSVYKTVVFEECLKGKLEKFTRKKKIVVIPHVVEEFKENILRKIARDKLKIKNEFVILYFGFIAWYKGTDWIIDKIKKANIKNNIKFIIAGGANPNHKDKPFYTDYVRNIEKSSLDSNGQVSLTGFVEQKDIPLYFSACDLVILPYRTLMSSSGPLSLAFSFGKPFLVSDNMKEIFKTKDMVKLAEKLDIKITDLIFNMLNGDLEKKIKKMLENQLLMNKMFLFSENLRKVRSFDKIGSLYYKEIFL